MRSSTAYRKLTLIFGAYIPARDLCKCIMVFRKRVDKQRFEWSIGSGGAVLSSKGLAELVGLWLKKKLTEKKTLLFTLL